MCLTLQGKGKSDSLKHVDWHCYLQKSDRIVCEASLTRQIASNVDGFLKETTLYID